MPQTRWGCDVNPYYLGVKVALEQFKVIAPAKPAQPTQPKVTAPTSKTVQAASTTVKGPASTTVGSPTAQTPALPKPPTVKAVKTSEFNQGLYPKPKDKDAISAENECKPRVDLDEPTSRRLSHAFQSLVAQKNLDVINAGNEAAFTSPGV
jgi:hypothetical protein